MSKKKSDEFSYNAAMKELQEIVQNLQNDTIGIDDLAEKVSRASELIKLCKEKLHQTEEAIQEMSENVAPQPPKGESL